MPNVSTGPMSAASHSATAGPDSTSRAPPATASATQPISGIWPVSSATAVTRSWAEPKKWAEANSTANVGDRPPSDARASPAARLAASRGSAVRTRAPPAFISPGYFALVWPRPIEQGRGPIVSFGRVNEPIGSRPYMPGYGTLPDDEGGGLLPWSWAEE